MKVGFLGLGRMGSLMALNLVKGGASLVVYDINQEAVAKLVAAGAKAATNLQDLAGQVEVLFTSLPDPKVIEEVVLGPGGILDSMAPGLTLFETSTSSLSLNRRIEEAFRAKGGAMLDAPVSGGPVGAKVADLAIWVSGDKAVFERYEHLLRMMGDKTRYVGNVGAGTVAKLTHNMLGNLILQSLAEVFSLGVKAGVEPMELWEALRLGSAGKQSPLMLLVNQFLPAKFDPAAFALKLAHKDVTLVTNMARELGVPVRLTNLTLEEMTEAMSRGWGELDARSSLRIQMERAGVDIKVDPERLQKAVEAAKR